MEISFLDSSILDESIEVVIDFNSNEVLTLTPIVKKQKVDLFACPSCAYSTNSRGNLYRHKRSVHQKKKEECPTCGKTYASAYDLRTHVRVVHGENPFLCESCCQRFNNRAALKRHRDVKHADVCKFNCATCGKKYYEREAYIGHMNKHIGSKPYSCKCGTSFGYKSCLRRHMQTCQQQSTKKKHKCDTCGEVLNSRTVLLDHVQGKHGEKLYTCPCGKSFSCRPSLARYKKACKSA